MSAGGDTTMGGRGIAQTCKFRMLSSQSSSVRNKEKIDLIQLQSYRLIQLIPPGLA